MSGFCGVVDFAGALDKGLLTPVMSVLAPFGGHDAGIIEQASFALGHQLRHTTPESLFEQQPSKHPSRELYMVADAWLDNRAELCQHLSISQSDARQMPDSQLILKAYEHWGEACPEHLLGDFSFAIWDHEKRTLFCARDHIGTKPFYYYQTADQLYFANDIEALLAFDAVPPRLDLQFARGRLESATYFHTEHTDFEGVKKLPFAHTMQVTKQDIKFEQHWQPENFPPLILDSEEAYSERLLELLGEAVKCRMRSVHPIGSHFSGGLDSSTIAVLAAREAASKAPFHTFTWSAPPEPDDYPLEDERKDIETIASAANLQVHYATLDSEAMFTQFMQDATRRPQHTLMKERLLSCKAKQLGIQTLLSGWGGDEAITFNGRGYFANLFQTLQWKTLVRELQLRSSIHGGSWARSLIARGVLPNVPKSIASTLSLLAKKHPAYGETPQLPQELHPNFANLLSNVSSYKGNLAYEVAGVRTMQLRLINHGHITQRMESWHAHGERIGMTYRYPLLDKRLLEFALRIPEDLFFKNGWKRYIFRRSLTGILPKETQWKKSKREPSVEKSLRQVVRELQTDKVLENQLELRREQLTKQQFVNPDDLIVSLNAQQIENAVPRDITNRAMWLGFVRDDVYA